MEVCGVVPIPDTVQVFPAGIYYTGANVEGPVSTVYKIVFRQSLQQFFVDS